MANNSELKGTVNDYVKQNGAGGITGQGLQTILDTIIDSLGGKYQYAGVAAPSTNPGTPDQNVFYLAATAGTYTNFGGIVLTDGEVAVLKGSGSSWTKEVTGIASAEEVSQLGQEVGTDDVVSKELVVSSEAQNVIRWQDAFGTGRHLGDTVVVKINSNTAVLVSDDNHLRVQYKVNGVTKSADISIDNPYIVIDGNVIGGSVTGIEDLYDLKVFTDANTVTTAGTVVVEVLTALKAKGYYNTIVNQKQNTAIGAHSLAIDTNTLAIAKINEKIADSLITHEGYMYRSDGQLTGKGGYGCTDKIKLSDIDGLENGIIPIVGGFYKHSSSPDFSVIFFAENGTTVTGTYSNNVDEGQVIPYSAIPNNSVYAGFNTYLAFSPDGLLIKGYGVSAKIVELDNNTNILEENIDLASEIANNIIYLSSGYINTTSGRDTPDANRCRISDYIHLDSIGDFYYLRLYIGGEIYNGTRILYDADKNITTQANAVYERAYFNIPLPIDFSEVRVIGVTGWQKRKDFNIGKYYPVLNRNNAADIIANNKIEIADGKLECDGSYVDELSASPIINNESYAYIGFHTETKAAKRDYDSLKIVAINHDDTPNSDIIGNRKIYNKYGYNASFNYILMPYGNTDTKAIKIENIRQMLAEGHDLGLHAILNASYWVCNPLFELTPNSQTLFAPTISDLQGENADHTGTNAFGRSVTTTTTLAQIGFADLPGELASVKVVELTDELWIATIRKYNLYLDDSLISGLDLNDNIVSKTRLGWLEYWYNELIDDSLGYSDTSDTITAKYAADYTGTYPTAAQITSGDLTSVGHFTKGLYKDCASSCNYEVMDRCIEIAKAVTLHYYGIENFRSFHIHGVRYFKYAYVSSTGYLYCDSGKNYLLSGRQKLYFSRSLRWKSQIEVLISEGIRATANNEIYGGACILEGQRDLYYGYPNSKPLYFNNGGMVSDYLNFFGINAASGGLLYSDYVTFLEGLNDWLKFAFENAKQSVTRNGKTYTVFGFLKDALINVKECEGTGKIPVLSFDTIRFDPSASTAVDMLLRWLYKNGYKVVPVEEARSIAASFSSGVKTNYFPNPIFRQGIVEDFGGSSTSKDAYVPDGWKHTTGTLDSIGVSSEAIDGETRKVLSFESDNSNNTLRTRIYGLLPGTYKLTFYAKGSGSIVSGTKVLNGTFIDNHDAPFFTINTGANWQEYEETFIVPEPNRELTEDAVSILCDGFQNNIAFIEIALKTGTSDTISIASPKLVLKSV